jgi:hypothetical protein
MGYKLIGFVVWQGGRWYLRRRFPGAGRKAALAAGLGVAVIGGAAVAQRQLGSR